MSQNVADSGIDRPEDLTNLVLSELGLNEYEIRAYLTILEGGIVVAREISDRSAIPYAKVYQVLEGLSAKQLIIGDEGRPKKFRCRDPKDALNDRLTSIKEEFDKQHSRKQKLVENSLSEFTSLYSVTKEDVEDEKGVWTITGLSNILSRINKLLEQTTETIRISSGNKNLLLNRMGKLLSSIPPNIDVQIRSTLSKSDLDPLGKHYAVKDVGDATILIFDHSSQISIVETSRGKYTSGEYIAVLTNIDGIVSSSVADFDLTTNR